MANFDITGIQDPSDVADIYLTSYRAGGAAALAVAYPAHPYVAYLPAVESATATGYELASAERCQALSGPLSIPVQSCARGSMPGGLPPGSAWPTVVVADCLGCVRAGDHVPEP